MRKIIILLGALLPLCSFAQEQTGITQCGRPTNQPVFPLASYTELPDHQLPDAKAWATVKTANAAWGNTNTRYNKAETPKQTTNSLSLKAWRGEKVNAQAVVYTPTPIEKLNYSVSQFKGPKGENLPADAFTSGFVRYVMTDQVNKDGKGGCGYRPDHTIFDSTLVADPIDHLATELSLKPMNSQGIWISCAVPQNTTPGNYKGTLTVKDGDKALRTLPLEIQVSSRTLPAPSDWTYHLDLWQNPFAVARYYQLPLWSDAHLEAMRPIMKRLADAGQRIITTSIMHKPWGGQTHDYFETMITWTKKIDGTWAFDYSAFDRWVEFMMNVGIDQQISCYSMIPWKLSFLYFDQASNSMKSIDAKPGETQYTEMWSAMLTSFSKHLREKGWFSKTVIAMDERPMKSMQEAIKVIRASDPEFKISLAGNYHQELEKDLYDYSIAWGQTYPEDVLKRRQTANQYSTYYTCCSEVWPNMFTFSKPTEAIWLSMAVAKAGVDGYLRWAFNSWPLEPLLDSRFSAFAGGDTYLIYPGARSSIRLEKLIEGIQAYEKIKILQAEFDKKGNTSGNKKIKEILAPFNTSFATPDQTQITVEKALEKLNKL